MIKSVSSAILLFIALLACVPNVICEGDSVYCATGCGGDSSKYDPCGDGQGQSTMCTDVELTTIVDFGYTSATDVPTSFLGCSKAKCEEVCKGYDASSEMSVVDDFFCFPSGTDGMMQGMFMKKDYALMSAVSRGCSGSHEMAMGGMDMHMHGGMHGECDDSYSDVGVTFSASSELCSILLIPLIPALLLVLAL